MGKSGISYLDAVWNPILGCSPKMPCAARCWAWRTVARVARVVNPRQELIDNTLDWGPFGNKPCGWSGKSALVKPWLDAPLHWRKPQRIGVCFLGDLFADAVPDEWIGRVLNVCASARQHRYFFLTKQAERMRDAVRNWFGPGLGGYGSPTRELAELTRDSLRLGVSVCNQAEADERIPILQDTPAAFRWASIEPMIDEIDLTASGKQGVGEQLIDHLNWVVVGCESGPGRRPCDVMWVNNIVLQCHAAHVPVFVKQIMDKDGRVSHNPTEWPEWLRQQEQP